MSMTPREIITANIEFGCEGRIGFDFSGDGRLRDFVGVGCEHGIETRRWEEGEKEYYTDIWGNVWHRIKGMSAGGEVSSSPPRPGPRGPR